MSVHETPIHTSDATKEVSPETTNRTLKNVKFWCVSEGALPPVTPINPYLGEALVLKGVLVQAFLQQAASQQGLLFDPTRN